MSMCVRYAGDSYRYLLDSVTTDHGRTGTSPMTRYYTATGTPPGTWLGTGLAGLASGVGLPAGSFVTPRHMERLFRDALDPSTGEPLGRSPHLSSPGSKGQRRRPVAGFDCTFTVPKSVSVLWALADDGTREVLYDVHRTALADVLAVIDRDVARTRIGTNGVAQVETQGVVAAAFDHWDSRENDPNLHTHVVIANRVQGLDGRWRTLDSRAMHRAAVAMSERYDAILADHVNSRLGLEWEYRERGPSRNPAYELAAVPSALNQVFSRRSAAIGEAADRLIERYVAEHGRHPDAATVLRLRQQATLSTRGTKEAHSLADLSDAWRHRAPALGADPTDWAARILATGRASAGIEAAAASGPLVSETAARVLAALSRTRATWTPWNVDAEASRALRAVRFASAPERDRITAEVVAEVARRAVLLAAPELATTPAGLRRSDGASAFRRHRGERYTSHQVLDAEARLLAAGRDHAGPTVRIGPEADAALFDDQQTAVVDVAGSGRVVDVLVGPAGSGKTRTLTALRTAWEVEHGPDSVTGLAPSAAAADVLATALGVAAENTAKWLVEHDQEPARLRRIDQARAALHAAPDSAVRKQLQSHLDRLTAAVERWRLRPGQLVIVDEASLADTLTLDRLAACAGEAGAKLLLVGDWAQLSSIEAGGAFGLLVRDRGTTAPELDGIRRFAQAWEREASTRLRTGDITSIDTYATQQRITDGDRDRMVDAAYSAWLADTHACKNSLLLAGDLATVQALNERARVELIATGQVQAAGTTLRDGLRAGVGDRIVSRRNDRHLRTGRGWVKNGDRWTVVRRYEDGALGVQRSSGGAVVTLPATYVAEHVELAYATTAFRAQGATVDTAHAIVTGPGMTREVLYVMLTRAREANHAYVCTDRATEPLHGFTDEPTTGRSVLTAVLRNVGASVSAHETVENEHESASSIRTLAAEYGTIAHVAEAPRCLRALAAAGLPESRCAEIESSPAFGALTLALRRSEALGLDVTAALPRLLNRSTTGADDVAAVLHARVERWTSSSPATANGGDLVVGLLPALVGLDDPGVQAALSQRADLMTSRADALVERARTAGTPWLSSLPPQPPPGPDAEVWRDAARTIAAYRERWDIDDPARPLGIAPAAATQQAREHELAAASLARLSLLEAQPRRDHARHPGIAAFALARPTP